MVVDVDGGGNCKSGIGGSDPNCVPMDVFGFGTIDPGVYDYIYAPTFTRGEQKLTVLNAGISGELSAYGIRSEEHTSELQSLMRISYAVFCLKKKKLKPQCTHNQPTPHTQPTHQPPTHHN